MPVVPSSVAFGGQRFPDVIDAVATPADVDVVVVEGRDLANGWGGQTVDVVLDRG